MHLLCHYLNQIGEEAYIHTGQTNPLLRTPLLTQEVSQRHVAIGATPVAIYPEIVHGNPFNASLVVRYILNHPGLIGGPKTYDDSDLLVYYHEIYVPPGKLSHVPTLFISCSDSAIFNNDDNEFDQNRSGKLIYAGRDLDAKNRYPELFADATIITREWPATQQELAALFRKSKVLYCFANSAVAGEAIRCGCPAVIMDSRFSRRPEEYGDENPEPWPGATYDASEEGIEEARKKTAENWEMEKLFREKTIEQLEHFIHLTQTMKPARITPPDPLESGIQAFHAGNYATAIEFLSTAMTQAPENPLAPAYLAFVSVKQGLFEEAEDFIGKALEIAPERADLQAALGEVLLQAGQAEAALRHLQTAVFAQTDLYLAYPALAQSLFLTGQGRAAVSLLQSAASLPSPAQANIRESLLEILVQRADIAGFAECCRKFSRGLADDLLAASYLSHCDTSGEIFLETLARIQAQCAENPQETDIHPFRTPLKIAFLVGDFKREQSLGRLVALLRFLPPEEFTTLLVINGLHENDCFNLCLLLADQTLQIIGEDDAAAREKIRQAAPDILIDLDAYGPEERLKVFLEAEVPRKFLWGEAPMPPLSPRCQVLAGARLADPDVLPCVTLPEMGEYCDLPEWPIESLPVPESTGPMRFGCLTPAMRIGREGWRLFAAVLDAYPESTLLVNLHDLGKIAREFIEDEFVQHGIAAERLRFVHAHRTEDFCRFWRETDLGLAPPVDTGHLALPSCLWMGRPYLALASPLPWSRRATALLEIAGARGWIADTPEEYVEKAKSAPAPTSLFREHLRAAGLTDPVAFAQGFAAALLGESGL
jgi:predicted O-linked N-acetylglucosamine transferase (SPINDLY family)